MYSDLLRFYTSQCCTTSVICVHTKKVLIILWSYVNIIFYSSRFSLSPFRCLFVFWWRHPGVSTTWNKAAKIYSLTHDVIDPLPHVDHYARRAIKWSKTKCEYAYNYFFIHYLKVNPSCLCFGQIFTRK